MSSDFVTSITLADNIVNLPGILKPATAMLASRVKQQANAVRPSPQYAFRRLDWLFRGVC